MSTQQKQNNATVLTPQILGVELPETIELSTGCAVWVRALLQNWRQGTVAVQGRSDVSYSNKKPWKQKGTGRARAGSKRSPIWKGGGVIHGPQPRTKQLKVGKKTKQHALSNLFAHRLRDGKIHILDWAPSKDLPSTKNAFAELNKCGLVYEPLVVFAPIHDHVVRNSFANIPNVHLVSFDAPNAFDVLLGKTWIVLQKDIEAFKEMVSRWS